jgi:hypothetical protein
MKTASRKQWQTYLSSLERTEGYPRELEGYLMALATCYKAYKEDYSFSDLDCPWEQTADATPSNIPQTMPTKPSPLRSPGIKS